MEQMTNISSNICFNTRNTYITSLIYGLGGHSINTNLAGNIIEALFKIVDSEYNSHVGWRDSLVKYF